MEDPHPHEANRLRDFFAHLADHITGDLYSDRIHRVLYASDASMYQILPLGVLIPRHEDDVQAAVESARAFQVPLLARGSGSSLAGQTVGAALVIDFTRHLDAVESFDSETGIVSVQPGITHQKLNRHLASAGWQIGPDPASGDRATIGGMTGNNATGTHSILYGSMVDHVVSTRGVLSDGSVFAFRSLDADAWRSRVARSDVEGRIYDHIDRILEESGDAIRADTPRHWRRSGGYRLERLLHHEQRNLSSLLCGSEGTLAVITGVTVAAVPRPAYTGLGVVHFRNRRDALETVVRILETEPSAVELLDRHSLDQCREVSDYARKLSFVEGRPEALLITEYYGESTSDVEAKVDRLARLMTAHAKSYAVTKCLEPQHVSDVWDVRKAGLGLIMGARGDHKPLPLIEDAAVPVESLAEYVTRLEDVFSSTSTRYVLYAHASAGCLHIRPFINTRDAGDVRKMCDIAEASMELVSEFGGALSSEHGEGLARSWLAERFYGRDLYAAYRATKHAFDPEGLFNPGKITDAPAMTENLRIAPGSRPIQFREHISFHKELGFAASVEHCTGIGVCRKTEIGTMCPSFMATREEKHSTRGRANVLRAAVSGMLPPDTLTSTELADVMRLCISCKACKSECPSGVDMAKIKLEWQAHYHDRNGITLRDRVFGGLPALARFTRGPLARLAGAFVSGRTGGALIRSLLDLASERDLPLFAPRSFLAWWRQRTPRKKGRKRVVLFHDTFNTFQEPEVSIAAVRLLDLLGFEVELGKHVCCGRTYISRGLVHEARACARQTVAALYENARLGTPVIGLEPSCILTLRDEYYDLLPGDPRVDVVASAAVTLEEFLQDSGREGHIRHASWDDEPRLILVHGHCHQKALVGMAASADALSMASGHQVQIIDSGCCGMAGAFGYEREHYPVSLKMAEDRLAPTVRAAPPDAIIVAAGTSCRTQIEHVTGRRVLHPAQVLLASLAKGRG
jgi:FAD/FMN-containing dehydrogenase/Fe-S oxidoreductase